MRIIIGIIILIISFYYYSSYKEKKELAEKNTLICSEVLSTNSAECIKNVWIYVNDLAKKKANLNLTKFKREIEEIDNLIKDSNNSTKLDNKKYPISSGQELDSQRFSLLLEEVKKKRPKEKNSYLNELKQESLIDKNFVIKGSIGGCLTYSDENKYFFCTIEPNSESRSDAIFITNIDKFKNYKKIYDKINDLYGIKKSIFNEFSLFSPFSIYDVQAYGRLKKVNVLDFYMEIDGLIFLKELVSDKQLTYLLKSKIFNIDWEKVKKFKKSKNLK